MEDKLSQEEIIKIISKSTNQSIVLVSTVVKLYRNLVTSLLEQGYSYRVSTLFRVQGFNKDKTEDFPLAYVVGTISEGANLPYYTVKSILDSYIDLAKDEIFKEKSFTFLGLATLYAKEGGINSRLAPSLASRVTGMRVRVFPNFRKQIKGSEVVV